ncbi:Ig-like domain repeat protein [Streptomyces tubercidicus]|uniref:Ig-like domain repeat protein n=1 Tax=Streptomyces tubercidicus TaxID=47759 RepID=UPI0022B7D064|nr:Ig-like domain repeat protein [Streptomyces tubercidicus]WAU10100.1 Ig-like domain repeat protein [Streptomyces tubercidicus]
MLTPESPYGLAILTDCQGNGIALVDPLSHRVVPLLGAPAPLPVRDGVGGGPVVRTVVDGAATLLGALAGVRNRLASTPSWGRLDTVAARPGLLAERNQFSGVFPDQGSSGGGTLVTIIGRNFTRATTVNFGPRPAASFAVLDDRTIVAVTPSGQGSVPITVTTPGGSARVGYFFYLPWPSLAGIAPATGPIGGGNTVILTGANLSTSLRVYFGDAVAFPTVLSDREISVTVPPTTGPGTVPVYVTTLGGVSNRLLYTYATVAHVTGVSPDTGPIAGGTTLVLTGSGLARVTGVTIGGVPVSSFRAFSDSLLVVVTPPGVPGPADIVLTTPGGSVTLPGGFDYKAPSVVTVTSAPDPAPVGQPVTFTATLEGVPSTTGTPSGTVLFDFGDGTAPVTASLTDGTATVEHAYTGPSDTPYAVTVNYGGDPYFLPATGTDTQVIEAASTTTTVTSGPDPSQVGQPVTFVARVAPTPPGAGAPTGTVTFDFGDGTAPVTMPMAGGSATVTHAYPDAAELPYPVTATYSGDDNFTASTGTDSQTVEQAATTTAVDLAPQPSVAGQPVTVTATVAAVPPGVAVPTGTVTFDFGDGTPPVDVPLTDGTAAISHAYAGTAASPYTVTATYQGNGNLEPSTGTGSQSVGPSGSTTTVVSAPDPSTVGEPVTFGATVSALAPGAGTPTGTVTFDFGDGSAPVTAPLTDGTATTGHVYTAAEDNPYTVTATYDGDADFTTSSGTDTQSVQPAGTALAVVSTPDPSTVGEPVTFGVTVSALAPGAGTPTGTVTFDFGDGAPPGTASLTDGAAEITHTYTDAAELPYPVTATYNGDADFTTSLGTDTQTVQPADTTTSVNSAPDPSTVGQLTTFVAQISPEAPAAGAPTGTVTFAFGDGTPPVTAPVEGGTAKVTHANPEVAESPYTVAAAYSGDDNFNPSAGTDSQLVAPAVPTTTVTSTPAPSVTGETVTFTATVAAGSPAAGTPTGSVTFDFGDGTAPVTAPLTDGTAALAHAYTTAPLSPFTVTVTYSGDINFTASVGIGTHSVEEAATVTTVTAAPDPSVTGESVTVTVAPTAPASGIPTGAVSFDFGDGTPVLTAQLVDGTVTVTHPYTSVSGSPYTITAVYLGDANYAASEDTIVHAVDPAETTTTVTSSRVPSAVGESVTLIARVVPVPPGAGTPAGTVTFDFGDGSAPATAPVSHGVAMVAHTYTSTAGSPYPVTAAYSGDGDFGASTGTAAQGVEASVSATSTTVSSAPDPSVVGEPVTVSATVVAVPPAAGTPTGTVTFEFGDGTPAVTSPLTGATATATHTYTAAAAPHTITAVYSGDGNFAGSAGLDTHTVEQAATSTTVDSAPDPSLTGQDVTFTATVTSTDADAGTPTGSVTFDFGDGTPAVRAPLSDGTAIAVHAYPHTSGSPYPVTATYHGEASFLPSTDTDTQTVNAAAVTFTVFSSKDPSAVGQPVTLTANLAAEAPAAGTPTGTITFDFGDGTPTVTATAVGGTVTVTHAYTTAVGSPYTFSATYSGDDDFSPATATGSQTLHPAATTTEVTSGPEPAVVGQPVTITATVAPVPPGAGTPTGTVTIDFGDDTTPATVPLAGGAATVTHAYTGSLSSPYTITATYSGSDDFTNSVATSPQSVLPDATTTTVSSAPDPSVVGQPVTFTATVTAAEPGSGAPTGTVIFDFGDGTDPVAQPVTDGVATAEHAYTGPLGSPYTITATYGGDTDSTASSGTTTQAVGQAASTTLLTSSPEPAVSGQPVTVTATLSAAAPGDGTPTGTVTFDFGDGTSPTTVPVTSGVATTTHTWTGASGSPYSVTAAYSGDSGFLPSTATGTQTVARAATSTTVTGLPDPSITGRPVDITATVSTIAPGAGTPTGTVLFDFGDGTPPLTAPLTDGTATVTHAWPGTSGSPYTVTAAYNGDADFSPSTGTDTHTVAPATTSTTVSGQPDPSVTGQPVMFLARVTSDAVEAGAPTGTVTFDFGDGTAPVTVAAAGGVATAVHAYTSATGSPYTVRATYDGDDRFTASVGTRNHGVQPSLSATTVSSLPDPSATGQPVDITATVSAAAPGAGTPTGTVTFDFGDGTAPVTAPVTDGTATVSHAWASTSGSPYALTAAYSGDADFSPSTGTGTQTVTPAATTTEVASSPDPSVTGQPVDITATVSAAAPGAGTPTGTVTFDFGDGTPSVTATVTAGVATVSHTWTGTAPGPYTITAAYGGDADFSPSTGTRSQTVGQATSTISLFSSPDPSVAGQQVTFTALVSAVPPGAGAPTGTVTFDFGDGTAPVTAPVTSEVATVTHAYVGTSGSPYTVTADYSGDDDFTSATATGVHTVAVSAATTSTTVSSAPDPAVTGQPVSFTATVAPTPPGAGVPTGTVTFTFGDGTAAVTAPLSGGIAGVTHVYNTVADSPYTVTAGYSGDANFSSSSGTDSQTVAPASTLTTVTATPDPSVVGQPVTLTATVAPTAPGAGVPTGAVTFTFGDGTPPTLTSLSDGVARITHTYTSAGGPYQVTADYDGDAGFLPSSGGDSQTVGRAATSTAVVSSPDPTVVGQLTTVTASVASVAPGAGAPSGTVTFDFGDGSPTLTAPVSDGLAVVTHAYGGTSGSPFVITGTYGGDANFTSSSGGDTQTVGKAATSTGVVSSPDPTVVGQLTTVTASVASIAPGAGAPSGTVTFDFGDGSPTLTAPVSDGRAVVTHAYSGTSGSPFVITGTYGGDANFTSSSGHDTQSVGKAATTTAVASSPDPTVVGQPTTLTASVASATPGAAVPTGTVTFTFGDGTGSTTTTLTDGIATVTHTYATRSGSPFHLTATYNGDSGFTASSGSDSQTVGRAATTTELVSSPDPSVAGQAVTLTATVSAVAPGAGTPTGTVTFSFGDGTSAATKPLSNGTATVTHTFNGASVSPYAVTAIYNGDGNFTASSGSDTQTVGKVATTTELVSSPDPSVAGQAVTLTATVASTVPGAGTPTGTVTFGFGDGTSAGTATLSGGIATVTHTYASRSGSPFPLTATYNGDATFSASTGTDTQTLSKNVSTTTVTSTPDPSASGGTVTIRATVSSPAGTPTGTVTFSFGDGTGTATGTLSGGVATVTHAYTTTTGSPFTVTATYGGDAGFTGSTGSDTQTVTRSATSTTVVSTPNPSGTGDRVTVTATVVPVAPGTGTPTGTVTLAIPGRTPQTVPLVGGQASATFNPLPRGLHLVTGNYNGDVSFAPSTGTTSQLVV